LKIHSARRGRLAPALAAGVFLAGCAATDTRIVGAYPGPLALQDWSAIANTNRPGRGEILKVVDLGRSEALSNHLAIVQSRELPHRHNRHDATVTLLRGHGTMTIGRETRHVREGAVIFIPRGVVHHYTNESDPPTVALVVYAPPFDGRDREIVTVTGTKTSPEGVPSRGESTAPGAPPPAPGATVPKDDPPAPQDVRPQETSPAPRTDDPGAPGEPIAPDTTTGPESSPGAVLDGAPAGSPPASP